MRVTHFVAKRGFEGRIVIHSVNEHGAAAMETRCLHSRELCHGDLCSKSQPHRAEHRKLTLSGSSTGSEPRGKTLGIVEDHGRRRRRASLTRQFHDRSGRIHPPLRISFRLGWRSGLP